MGYKNFTRNCENNITQDPKDFGTFNNAKMFLSLPGRIIDNTIFESP